MTATHVVVRSIPGEAYLPGDEVDATLWRSAEKLVGMRYLRPLNKDELRAKATTRERIEIKTAAREAAEASSTPADASELDQAAATEPEPEPPQAAAPEPPRSGNRSQGRNRR